jgi:hypothetical protein
MVYFSFFLTIVSILAHLSTYVGIYFFNEYYPMFTISYVIHGLIFIPFFAMVFRLSFGKNKIEKIKFLESFNTIIVFKRYFPNTNYKIAIILLVLFVYVFFNFYFSVNKLTNGTPEILDGKYVLNNHGEITEVDKKQYVEMSYTQLKAFSGHWIIFSVIPLVYFFDRIKGKIKDTNENNSIKE